MALSEKGYAMNIGKIVETGMREYPVEMTGRKLPEKVPDLRKIEPTYIKFYAGPMPQSADIVPDEPTLLVRL
jgi:hypothetical protein